MIDVLQKIWVFSFLLFTLQGVSQTNTVGVVNITANAQEGYTLFAPNSSRSTYLVDNCGNIVNEWLSEQNPGLSAYLLPSGDLVRTRRESNNTFFAGGVGGGIEIFDWNGTIKWEFVLSDEENVLHHDVAVLPNGNILAIAYELIPQADALSLGRDLSITPEAGMWADRIIEIKPLLGNEFEIVWEWRAIDHIVQDRNSAFPNFSSISDAPDRLDFNYSSTIQGTIANSDWMHSNAIDYNPELDQIILNSRNFNEFYIIDHSTTTEEASTSEGGRYGNGGDFLYRWGNPEAYGTGSGEDQRLYSQHDAHWIDAGLKDEGKVFVFNNGINRPGGSISSVDLIETSILADGTYEKVDGQAFGPTEAEWVYGLEADHIDITSQRISGVSRLPNGNTVITVGGEGRIVELDENLDIAWDYELPLAGNVPISQGETTNTNTLFRSYRYTLDDPAFINNFVEIGVPIELNPNNEFCFSVPTEELVNNTTPLELINTMAFGELGININANIDVAIIDINGRVHFTHSLFEGTTYLDISSLPVGMFFIQTLDANYPILQPLRFIKMN